MSTVRRVLVVVAGLGLLAGCHSPANDAGPTASGPVVTPSPTPTQSREDVAKEQAETAYRNYMGVVDEVSANYYHGWQDKVLPLIAEPAIDDVTAWFTEGETNGYHQVGQRKVGTVSSESYGPDTAGEGRETVQFQVCIDSTNIMDLSPEGTDEYGTAGRYLTNVTMVRIPAVDEQGVAVDDAADPYGQAWWRMSSGIMNYNETC